MSNIFTEEQKQTLYDSLTHNGSYYEIKVFKPFGIYHMDLDQLIDGRYSPNTDLQMMARENTNPDYPSNIVSEARQIGSLNAVIREVKLYDVPLYINSVPEIARWRLLIGV